jgi:hypothetical protein
MGDGSEGLGGLFGGGVTALVGGWVNRGVGAWVGGWVGLAHTERLVKDEPLVQEGVLELHDQGWYAWVSE